MHRLPRALTLRQQITGHYQPGTLRSVLHQRNYTRHSSVIRPVRLKRPGWNYRRVATYAIYAGAGYAYVNLLSRYFGIEFVEAEEEVDDAQREGVEEEGEEDTGPPYYAEEDSFFIPMTWSKKMPRSWYRGSDPEWQEFVKVAGDKPRQKRIAEELVQTIFKGAKKHPMMIRQLGPDPKVGKYWLDSTFPDGPPQEYERSGIEWGEGFIAWSQQKVDPQEQWRIDRALWPQATLESVWAMSKVTFGMSYRRAKRALGWEEDANPAHPEERFKHAIEMMQKHQRSLQGKDGAPSSASRPDMTNTQAPARSSAQVPDQQKKIPLPFGMSIPNPLGSSDDSEHPPVALHVFRATLAKHWNPKTGELPRGSYLLQGLIEIKGGRGRFMLDVQAAYDPGQNKFVAMNANAKSYKRWQQRPKGGA